MLWVLLEAGMTLRILFNFLCEALLYTLFTLAFKIIALGFRRLPVGRISDNVTSDTVILDTVIGCFVNTVKIL